MRMPPSLLARGDTECFDSMTMIWIVFYGPSQSPDPNALEHLEMIDGRLCQTARCSTTTTTTNEGTSFGRYSRRVQETSRIYAKGTNCTNGMLNDFFLFQCFGFVCTVRPFCCRSSSAGGSRVTNFELTTLNSISLLLSGSCILTWRGPVWSRRNSTITILQTQITAHQQAHLAVVATWGRT